MQDSTTEKHLPANDLATELVNTWPAHRSVSVVVDDIASDVNVSLEVLDSWNVHHVELRRDISGGVSWYAADAFHRIEAFVQAGGIITSVVPQLFLGAVEDTHRWKHEVNRVAPEAIDRAGRLACDTLVVGGFEEYEDRRESRLHVLHALEYVAERAVDVDMTVAIENRVGHWFDGPERSVSLLREIDHPALKVYWHPAELLRSGTSLHPDYIEKLGAYLVCLGISDLRIPANDQLHEPPSSKETDADPGIPWCQVGQGAMPWDMLIPALMHHETLSSATLHVRCEPLREMTRDAIDFMRERISMYVSEVL